MTRLICPLKFGGGVMERPVSCEGLRVHVPLPLLVPADKVAPGGTWATSRERFSDPSVSIRAAVMVSGIAVSSSPAADCAVKSGVVATPSISTVIMAVSERV